MLTLNKSVILFFTVILFALFTWVSYALSTLYDLSPRLVSTSKQELIQLSKDELAELATMLKNDYVNISQNLIFQQQVTLSLIHI